MSLYLYQIFAKIKMMADKRLGLALSSGGVFGFAHIGVIEVLEERQIHPDIIAGSSSGAIIGLIYAAQGVPGLQEFVLRIKESGLLTPKGIFTSWSPDNFFRKLAVIVDKQVKESDFGDLKKDLLCVTTDVISGEPAILAYGNPVQAALASAAYPVAFTAKNIHNRPQVDGGLTQYLPAETLRHHSAKIVIGSCIKVFQDISREKARRLNKMSLGLRSIEILQEQLSRYQIRHTDFCFRPEFSPEDRFKFNELDKIIDIGREEAEKEIGKLQKILGDAQ
jgi:NTE family protein